MREQVLVLFVALVCGLSFLGAVSAGPLDSAGRKCWPHSRGSLRRGSRLTSQGAAILSAAANMDHRDANANEIFVACLLQQHEHQAEKILDFVRMDTGAFGRPMAFWAAQLQSASLWRAVCRYKGISPDTPYSAYDRVASMNDVPHRPDRMRPLGTYQGVSSTTFETRQTEPSSSRYLSRSESTRTRTVYHVPSPVHEAFARSPSPVYATFEDNYSTSYEPIARPPPVRSSFQYHQPSARPQPPVPDFSDHQYDAFESSQAPPKGHRWYHTKIERPEEFTRSREPSSSQAHYRSTQGVSTTTDDPELEAHIRSNVRYVPGAPKSFRRSHTMPSHTTPSTQSAPRPGPSTQRRSYTSTGAAQPSPKRSTFVNPSDRYVTTFEIEEL